MKIGLVGCGHVGAASAYACILRGVGTEMILVDCEKSFAIAQAEDMLHATPFSNPIPVHGTDDFRALEGAGIVMIAAGVAQKEGETRLDLLKRNAAVFENIIPKILDVSKDAILLIATNPLDVMTQLATHIAKQSHGLPSSRIIGSGTILDTARFRALLAEHLGVSSHSVHAHVLGEHGDSEVLHWSGANVSNINIYDFAAQVNAPITNEIKEKIDNNVRNAAYKIIKGKGATWFGIGAGMARIAQAIIDNESAVICCSSLTKEISGVKNVCLSLPRIINEKGIENTIFPELSSEEEEKITKSANIISNAVNKILY